MFRKTLLKLILLFRKRTVDFYGQIAFLGTPVFTSLFVLNCCFAFVLWKNHVSAQCSFFPLYNKIPRMFPLLLIWSYLSSIPPHWDEKTLCLVLNIESSYTHACQSLCVLYIIYGYACLLSQRTQNTLPQESMRDREIRCCPDCHRIGKKH